MRTNGNDPVNMAQSPEAEYTGHAPLTKREYFAAKAMQGILVEAKSLDIYNLKTVAGTAVEMADALIEALNKEEE